MADRFDKEEAFGRFANDNSKFEGISIRKEVKISDLVEIWRIKYSDRNEITYRFEN